MQSKVDRILSFIVTACAVVVAGAVAFRTFQQPVVQAQSGAPPVFVKEWKSAFEAGTRIGPQDAPITIVDVADLECPVCRGFFATLGEALREYPTQVAAIHVSYPLNYHKFAMPAAKAAECASKAGKFKEWIEAVYEKQDSLGLKSWGSYAADAQIADTAGVALCATADGTHEMITKGLAFGESVNLTGTPTILVNGWKLSVAPTPDKLKAIIDFILKGDDPFSRKNWPNL